MDFSSLIDIVDDADNELGKYRIEFILAPKKLEFANYAFQNIPWQSVKFSKNLINNVPDTHRGVYAFAINQTSAILPPHNYIVYIGIAGRNSDRSLRARYKDYFDERKLAKRGGLVMKMVARWQDYLTFYFWPIDDNITTQDLQLIEEQLNTALLPPFSTGDIAVETKKKKRILG